MRTTSTTYEGSPAPPFGDLSLLGDAGELIGAIQRLALARSSHDVVDEVRGAARRLTDSDGAVFVIRTGEDCWFLDEDTDLPLFKGRRFPVRACLSGWSMLHGEPAIVEDVTSDDRVAPGAFDDTFVRSALVVPIGRHEPVGAIGSCWAASHRVSEREVALLQALADSTAVALETVMSYEELELAGLETLTRLALAAEFRDERTHAHTERVARLAMMIGAELHLPGGDIRQLGRAAPLHDIGKLAIPDAILFKPGPLTSAEFDLIKTHSESGARLLSGTQSATLRLAGEIALSHHERWDGRGYPHRLSGDAIPLSGRVVAVADVFDALTHERPYKRAWQLNDAIDEIYSLSGTALDPSAVAAFAALEPAELPL